MDREQREKRLHRYKEAFQEADAAAAVADAAGVMSALLQPHVLSGLMYRLEKHWQEKQLYTIQRDDTEFIIVESLKILYEKAATKAGPRRHVGGYLYVTCRNKGYAIHAIRSGGKGQISVESLDSVRDGPSDYQVPDLTNWEEASHKLIRIVRKVVIPTLGRGNIQRVMDYIFEAHDKGTYATNQEIADALGVSRENVRAWKSKGFKRLPDRLKKAGLLPKDAGVDLDKLLGDQSGEEDEDSADHEKPEE